MSPGGDDLLQPLRARLVRQSQRRRDTWASLDEARKTLPGRGRSTWKKAGMKEWDERVVEAFLVSIYAFRLFVSANPAEQKHGIRPCPDSGDFPVTAKFTLACTKEQEIVNISFLGASPS